MNKKERAETKSQSGDFRVSWLGYIAAAIFLYLEGDRLGNGFISVIGILVGVVALFVLLGTIPHEKLRKATNYVDESFRPPLYMIAIAAFIKSIFELINVTGTAVWIWVLLAVLFGFIIFDIVVIVKNMKEKAILLGWKATIIRNLKILSFVLNIFVFVMLLTNVQGIGAPYIWLAPGILSLLVVLILEGRFFGKESIRKID